MTRFIVLVGALAVTATANAQSIPNVDVPKRAAQRAVAKTNAHTVSMTAPDSGRTTSAPAPGASGAAASRAAGASRAAEDTASPRRVRATVANATTTSRRVEADTLGKVVLRREVFAYDQSGRRDPFVSLMTIGELRPMISDLAVVGILIDPTGRNSIAVLRDLSSKEQYRVRVGQQLGRMRVARIAQKSVTFTIEEFGYSRQQELGLNDSNQARTK